MVSTGIKEIIASEGEVWN